MLSKIFESFGTFGITATTSSSITLSLTGISSTVIPISTGIACGLKFSKKVIDEIVLPKNIKYKKQDEKDQQTIKPFEKFYRKKFQDNLIDESEYESLCNNFTINLEKMKKEPFLYI